MNELAIFAGAGGGILGGHLLGWRTICAVERDAYAAQVLAQRQNDGILKPFPIWSDVTTFDGKPWRGIVDVISGGFPCQDISSAGKGAGITGDRSGLWKEFARIIGEVRPRFAFVENSPMLTIRGLGVVLGDLAELGFDAEWGMLSAAGIGAPHIRERIWILAHSMQNGQSEVLSYNNETQGERRNEAIRRTNRKFIEMGKAGDPLFNKFNWQPQPDPTSMANGMASWMDELACSGNGQVPRVAATAFTLLAQRAGIEI